MADERIDIEVIDKVAKTIKPELLGIGAAAKNAYTQIARLKKELGVTGGAGMGTTMKAVASAERDATRASKERASQATATARALDKEALAAQRLETKYAQQARAASSQASYNKSAGIGRSTKSASDSYAVFDKAGVIDKTSQSLDTLGKKAELGRHHMLNLGFQVQDLIVSLQAGQNPLTVFIQQGGQIGQIAAQSGVGIGGMAKAIGGILTRAVFSATGAMVALVGSVAAVGVAMVAGSRETAQMSNALAISGNRADLTVGSFYKLADGIAESSGKSIASVRAIASAYAVDGRYSIESVTGLTQATRKFADLTGQSADDVVNKWKDMAEGPTEFAVKLSESYALLSVKQIEQIRLLEQQGQTAQATDLLVASLNKTLQNQTVNLGYLESAWNGVSNAISNAWTWLKQWGAEESTRPWSKVVSDIEGEIKARKAMKFGLGGNQSIWSNLTGGAGKNDAALAAAEKALGQAKQWAAIEEKRRKDAAANTRTQQEGIAASARVAALTERTADDNERATRAIAAYRKDLDAIKVAGGAVPTAAQQAQTEKKLREQYVPSLRTKPKKTPESQAEKDAKRLKKTLEELDRDLTRESARLAQNLVGMDATVADRMSSIEDSIDGVGGSLKDAEGNWTAYGKKVLDSVSANERAKESLATLASIYDSAIQPADDWARAQEQAALALKLWGSEADKADLINKWLAEQKDRYLDATNPMRQYNKALNEQNALLKFHGEELAIQTEMQRRYNEMVAANPALRNTLDKQSLRGESKQSIDDQKKQSFLSDLESSGLQKSGQEVGGNQWIIENYDSLYKQIDAMRKGDVDSERNAAAAKRELNERYAEARLEGTRGMFDQLATLQSSNVKELAAIGKAAAIAQATIDGVLAVQKALAQGGPLGIGLAVATGVAAAANVAKIAGIKGFQKGGYTGDMPAHAAVGAVHGREYVMDAATTARIGVPALDALRAGRLNPAPSNDNARAKVTVINNAGADVQVRERSDGELEIIVDRRLEARFGETMQRHMSQPNSKASQAVGSNFKVRRNR